MMRLKFSHIILIIIVLFLLGFLIVNRNIFNSKDLVYYKKCPENIIPSELIFSTNSWDGEGIATCTEFLDIPDSTWLDGREIIEGSRYCRKGGKEGENLNYYYSDLIYSGQEVSTNGELGKKIGFYVLLTLELGETEVILPESQDGFGVPYKIITHYKVINQECRRKGYFVKNYNTL